MSEIEKTVVMFTCGLIIGKYAIFPLVEILIEVL